MTDTEKPQCLEGKHALVTGGSRGIGAEICRMLGESGAAVSVLSRNGEDAQAIAGLMPHGGQALQCDVTDETAVRDAVTIAAARFGPIEILVNNAGGTNAAAFEKETLDGFRATLDVNLVGTFLMTRAALPDMKAAGFGRIVNIASTAALKGYPNVAAYCAAKHGVLGLTRSLAREVVTYGVTVNAVCPGYTDTDLAASAIANLVNQGMSKDEAERRLASTNPMKRLIRPEEVANAVRWLVEPGSDAVTGQAISISGGEVM